MYSSSVFLFLLLLCPFNKELGFPESDESSPLTSNRKYYQVLSDISTGVNFWTISFQNILHLPCLVTSCAWSHDLLSSFLAEQQHLKVKQLKKWIKCIIKTCLAQEISDQKTAGALEQVIWRQILCYTCAPLIPFPGHPIASTTGEDHGLHGSLVWTIAVV